MDVQSMAIGAWILFLLGLNFIYISAASENEGMFAGGTFVLALTVVSAVMITMKFGGM